MGRDRELRALEKQLQAARANQSVAVAVVGEPGIGKTRLMGELRHEAERSGCAVLMGRGSELEADAPFGPVVEALDEAVGDVEPAVLKRLGEERLAELAVVFPSLAGVGGRLATSLEVERYRCHYAVRAMLKLLTRERPAVLWLDDVHWADPASIELVSYLLRNGVPGLLLALTYRPQAPRLLVSAVTRAVRGRNLRLLELGPLSPEEAAKLLGDGFLSASVESLYAESGGNPFYLEHLARAACIPAGGVLPVGARTAEDGAVPDLVRATIEQELAGLSSRARDLAYAAAVAGDPFEVGLALAIAEAREPEAWTLLDELVAAEVVVPTDVPGRMQFRHPITRRAVYDIAGPGWRLNAHRRAAQILAERPAPLAVQARHVVRSSVAVGDEAAISLLIEASRAAAPRAPAAAASWLEAAVRLLPATAPTERRLELLIPLATVFGTLGRLWDSRTVTLEALDLLPETDTRRRVQLTAKLARIEYQLGRAKECRRLLTTALDDSEPGSPESGELTIELAKNYSMLGEWDQAAEAARGALRVARRLDDQELWINAAVASAYFEGGRLGTVPAEDVGAILGTTRAGLQEAASYLDGLSDEDLTPSFMEALLVLIRAEIGGERWGDAERHAERVLRVSRATGQGAFFLEALSLLVPTRMQEGRLAEARQVADMVVEAGQLVENDQFTILNEPIRCWLASLQGQTSVALAAGRNALRAVERLPQAQFAWLATICYGEALVEAGEAEEGRRHILAAGGPQLSEVPPSVRPHWLKVLAVVEADAGQIEEAEEMARRARTIADQLHLNMRRADADYAEAVVHLARGETEAAAAMARRSTETFRVAKMAIEEARARVLLARALQAAGDEADAVKELGAAHEVLEERGAVRLADKAARELRQLGHTVARRSSRRSNRTSAAAGGAGPESLSTREREVALLVTQGRTTRQVAEALFLSPKTIETHLAHIFAKLGVSSRAAMTAVLERSRVVDRDS